MARLLLISLAMTLAIASEVELSTEERMPDFVGKVVSKARSLMRAPAASRPSSESIESLQASDLELAMEISHLHGHGVMPFEAMEQVGAASWSVLAGGCKVDTDDCVSSPNFPEAYSSSDECRIALTASRESPRMMEVLHFNTHPGDVLTLNGKKYSGVAGPQHVEAKTMMTWKTDELDTSSGWKLCSVKPLSGTEAWKESAKLAVESAKKLSAEAGTAALAAADSATQSALEASRPMLAASRTMLDAMGRKTQPLRED